MFKLKVGDKIKVRENLNLMCLYNGVDVANNMLRFKNEICIISRVISENHFRIKEDNEEYIWTIKMLEYIKPQTLTIEMTSEPDVVVNCRTEEDAKYFCRWLDLYKKRWVTGNTYLELVNWKAYKKDTCYSVTQGIYGDTNLENWRKQDDNEKDVVTIIRFAPSMIQNDSIWSKYEAYKCLGNSTKLPNKNRELTDTIKLRGVRSKMNVFDDSKDTESNIRNVFVKNIKFNVQETIVEFAGGRDIKVTCQDCDTYSKEQAITQAIAKYCGYGTKRINELIKKFDV